MSTIPNLEIQEDRRCYLFTGFTVLDAGKTGLNPLKLVRFVQHLYDTGRLTENNISSIRIKNE